MSRLKLLPPIHARRYSGPESKIAGTNFVLALGSITNVVGIEIRSGGCATVGVLVSTTTVDVSVYLTVSVSILLTTGSEIVAGKVSIGGRTSTVEVSLSEIGEALGSACGVRSSAAVGATIEIKPAMIAKNKNLEITFTFKRSLLSFEINQSPKVLWIGNLDMA